VALLTFQLRVTGLPATTLLELAAKLLIVGGCAGGDAGGEAGGDAAPEPHPLMTNVVVAKRMRAIEQSLNAGVVTFLPFGSRCAHQR